MDQVRHNPVLTTRMTCGFQPIHMPSEQFIIHPSPAPVDRELLDKFRDVVTPHISDNLQRLSGVVGLQRFHRERKLLGTALTVKTRPGDNLMIYKALLEMQPGQVLVVDGGGETVNALVGELIMLYAIERGCAGFVLDAAIRDVAAFKEADFPCYARGVSHRGPYKNGPGQINVPVCIAGQVISPGDIVVGDEDGVVAFSPDQAQALLAKVAVTAANEHAVKAEIAGGILRQSWLDKVLQPHGL